MFLVGQEVTRCHQDWIWLYIYIQNSYRVILPQQAYFISFQKLGAWQSIVIQCKHFSVILSKFICFKTLTIIYTLVVSYEVYIQIYIYTWICSCTQTSNIYQYSLRFPKSIAQITSPLPVSEHPRLAQVLMHQAASVLDDLHGRGCFPCGWSCPKRPARRLILKGRQREGEYNMSCLQFSNEFNQTMLFLMPHILKQLMCLICFSYVFNSWPC